MDMTPEAPIKAHRQKYAQERNLQGLLKPTPLTIEEFWQFAAQHPDTPCTIQQKLDGVSGILEFAREKNPVEVRMKLGAEKKNIQLHAFAQEYFCYQFPDNITHAYFELAIPRPLHALVGEGRKRPGLWFGRAQSMYNKLIKFEDLRNQFPSFRNTAGMKLSDDLERRKVDISKWFEAAWVTLQVENNDFSKYQPVHICVFAVKSIKKENHVENHVSEWQRYLQFYQNQTHTFLTQKLSKEQCDVNRIQKIWDVEQFMDNKFMPVVQPVPSLDTCNLLGQISSFRHVLNAWKWIQANKNWNTHFEGIVVMWGNLQFNRGEKRYDSNRAVKIKYSERLPYKHWVSFWDCRLDHPLNLYQIQRAVRFKVEPSENKWPEQMDEIEQVHKKNIETQKNWLENAVTPVAGEKRKREKREAAKLSKRQNARCVPRNEPDSFNQEQDMGNQFCNLYIV